MKKTKTKRKTNRNPAKMVAPMFEDKTAKTKYCPSQDDRLCLFEGLSCREYIVEQAMLETSTNTSSRYGMHRPFKRVVIQAIIFE